MHVVLSHDFHDASRSRTEEIMNPQTGGKVNCWPDIIGMEEDRWGE